jgi:hypothetical protein
MRTLLYLVIAALVSPPRRDERGLSQSTETAILVTGAVLVAGAIAGAVTAYVKANLPTP